MGEGSAHLITHLIDPATNRSSNPATHSPAATHGASAAPVVLRHDGALGVHSWMRSGHPCGRGRRLYLAMAYRDHGWQVVGVYGSAGAAQRACATALGEVRS